MSMLRPRHPNISCISKGRTCNRRGQLAWADRSSACSSAQNKGICYWWPSGMQHLWLASCCRPDGSEFQERCCHKRSQLSPEYQYDCVWDWCSTQSSVSLSMQAWIPVWKKKIKPPIANNLQNSCKSIVKKQQQKKWWLTNHLQCGRLMWMWKIVDQLQSKLAVVASE